MVNIIKPKIKTVSKDGECEIYLDLNININISGSDLKISPEITESDKKGITEDDKTDFAIPEFKSTSSKNKLKFGKKE
jgi:hypothetical protein